MTKIREQIFLRHSPYATSALLTTLIWGQLQRTARLYHVTDSGNAYVMETSVDKGLVMVTTYVTAKHKSTWSDCSSKTWNSLYSAHTISKTDSWTAEIRIGIASATATKAWMNMDLVLHWRREVCKYTYLILLILLVRKNGIWGQFCVLLRTFNKGICTRHCGYSGELPRTPPGICETTHAGLMWLARHGTVWKTICHGTLERGRHRGDTEANKGMDCGRSMQGLLQLMGDPRGEPCQPVCSVPMGSWRR